MYEGFSGFKEDLNVKVYDVWKTQSDGKRSHGLGKVELKSDTHFDTFEPLVSIPINQMFFKRTSDQQQKNITL